QWPKAVRTMAGDAPIVRAIDSVCDATSLPLHRLLAPYGEHVVFGALGAQALCLDPGSLIFGETTVRGFWMSLRLPRMSGEERIAGVKRVVTLVASRELQLFAGETFALADGVRACIAAQTPGRTGKILLRS